MNHPWNSPAYAQAFNEMNDYHTTDIELQKSGPDNYFVRRCRDNTYKPNQYISADDLVALKMAGLKVRIVDWQGNLVETLDFKEGR